MALTMTRTRNQTTLTSLVTWVANVHGELAYVESRLKAAPPEPLRDGLARRRGELLTTQNDLYIAMRLFDPALAPSAIGTAEDWLKPFGRGSAGKRRYLLALGELG